MKRASAYYIFFLVIASFQLLSQTAVVSVADMNYGYFGHENKLDIAVSECKCSELFVSTDNGSIDGKDCHYILKPAHAGEAKITIKAKRKNKRDSVSTFAIQIFRVPDPVITSDAFYLTDTIKNKELLITFPTLNCIVPGLRIEYRFRVTHYRISLYRNNALYFQEQSNNNIFSNTLKSKLEAMENNDVLVFDEITLESKEGQRSLNPIRKIYCPPR